MKVSRYSSTAAVSCGNSKLFEPRGASSDIGTHWVRHRHGFVTRMVATARVMKLKETRAALQGTCDN